MINFKYGKFKETSKDSKSVRFYNDCSFSGPNVPLTYGNYNKKNLDDKKINKITGFRVEPHISLEIYKDNQEKPIVTISNNNSLKQDYEVCSDPIIPDQIKIKELKFYNTSEITIKKPITPLYRQSKMKIYVYKSNVKIVEDVISQLFVDTVLDKAYKCSEKADVKIENEKSKSFNLDLDTALNLSCVSAKNVRETFANHVFKHAVKLLNSLSLRSLDKIDENIKDVGTKKMGEESFIYETKYKYDNISNVIKNSIETVFTKKAISDCIKQAQLVNNKKTFVDQRMIISELTKCSQILIDRTLKDIQYRLNIKEVLVMPSVSLLESPDKMIEMIKKLVGVYYSSAIGFAILAMCVVFIIVIVFFMMRKKT